MRITHFIWFLLFSHGLYAQVQIDSWGRIDVTDEISYFIDETGLQSFEEIRKTNKFREAPDEGLRITHEDGNVWVRLDVNNPYSQTEKRILIFNDPSLYHITHFENGNALGVSGVSVDQKNKAVPGNHNAFQIISEPKQLKTIYFRIRSDNFITLTTEIYNDEVYHEHLRKEYLFLGLFYGIMILIMVYSLFLGFITRISVFLFYSFITFQNMLLTGANDGFTPMFLNFLVTASGGYFEYTMAVISNVTGIFFISAFLQLRQNLPGTDKVLKVLAVALSVSLVVILIADPNYGFIFYRPVGLIILVIFICVSIYAYMKNVYQAGYFLVATAGLCAFVIVYILSLYRLIEFSFLVQYSIHFGLLFNLAVLSIAIGVRVYGRYKKFIDEERQKQSLYSQKNEALEKMVWERTETIIRKETELRSIIENSDNQIWMVNKKYLLLEANSLFANSWERAFNRKLKRGENILDQLKGEEFKQSWTKRYERVLNGSTENFQESYLIDGSERTFETSGFPIRENGKFKAAVFFSRDITDRLLYERQLRDKNYELEKANQELDSFVYSASHDLKAPLSSIQGLISLVKGEMKLETRKQYYDMMERSIFRLDQFIRDIIDYSRNTRVENLKEEINIKEIVGSVLEDLKYMNSAENFEIHFEPDENYTFVSDSVRLTIVIRNLLSNAIRYGHLENQDPRIVIRWQIKKKKARIEIQDHGPGISKEHIGHIFNMFYRANQSSSGSGLGLYIVRETITKMGGTISVKSNIGDGTTFTIEIPNFLKHSLPQEV